MSIVDPMALARAATKRLKASRKKRRQKARAAKPSAFKRISSEDFYLTPEWRGLRYQALLKNDGRCELCGRCKHDGVMLHVDHIRPRSKFPKLALALENLQVLCEDCNVGKSNVDDSDWRRLDLWD